MSKRIFALIFLGWRFFLHFLKKLSPFHPRQGIEAYRANYEAEGLTTLSASERTVFPTFEKCVACDACVHAYFGSGRPYTPLQATPRDLALCLSRSMPDYPSARQIVARWTGLDRFEAVCPRGVNLRGIVALMKRHLETYDRSTADRRK